MKIYRNEKEKITIAVDNSLEHQYWCRKTLYIDKPNGQTIVLTEHHIKFLAEVLRAENLV